MPRPETRDEMIATIETHSTAIHQAEGAAIVVAALEAIYFDKKTPYSDGMARALRIARVERDRLARAEDDAFAAAAAAVAGLNAYLASFDLASSGDRTGEERRWTRKR